MAKTPTRNPEAQPHHHHGRADSADAFFPDPSGGPARIRDELGENLAESFLQSATSAEDQTDRDGELVSVEEIGGPFVETSDVEEFAMGSDGSNPDDAEIEPFPVTNHS